MGRPGARGLLLLAAFLGLCGPRGGLGGTRPNFPSPSPGGPSQAVLRGEGGRPAGAGIGSEAERAGRAGRAGASGARGPQAPRRAQAPRPRAGQTGGCDAALLTGLPAARYSQPQPVPHLLPVISEIPRFKVGHLTSRMGNSCGQPGCIFFSLDLELFGLL